MLFVNCFGILVSCECIWRKFVYNALNFQLEKRKNTPHNCNAWELADFYFCFFFFFFFFSFLFKRKFTYENPFVSPVAKLMRFFFLRARNYKSVLFGYTSLRSKQKKTRKNRGKKNTLMHRKYHQKEESCRKKL